jgi:hypothetical protein
MYTKGEWRFECTDEGELWLRIPGHDVYLGDMEGTCAECFANGELMAAAPQLLEAMKGLLVSLDAVVQHWDDYEFLAALDCELYSEPRARARALLVKFWRLWGEALVGVDT